MAPASGGCDTIFGMASNVNSCNSNALMVKKHMVELICHCFEYTREDIEQDFIENGRSTVMEKITIEKKMGTCECAARNPSGR